MPKFTVVSGSFVFGGKIVEPGGEVELTAERAKRLGDKVKAKQPEKQPEKQTKTTKPKAEA